VRPSLYLGFTRAIGTPTGEVTSELASSLKHYHYAVEKVKLSSLLRRVDLGADHGLEEQQTAGTFKHFMSYMTYGNRVRAHEKLSPDFLAALAINEVVERRKRMPAGQDTVFIFDSVMHRAEARLFREVSHRSARSGRCLSPGVNCPALDPWKRVLCALAWPLEVLPVAFCQCSSRCPWLLDCSWDDAGSIRNF
jgi:hypothetical protein